MVESSLRRRAIDSAEEKVSGTCQEPFLDLMVKKLKLESTIRPQGHPKKKNGS
jgi:hypothetical protein